MAYNEHRVVIGWGTFTVSPYGKVADESFVARKECSGIQVWRGACDV